MFRRKVYDELMDWKQNGKKPLLVYGQRQVGKTYIIDHFAKENFGTYIYADLSRDSSFRQIFESGDQTAESIIQSIMVVRRIKGLDPEDTIIFLDEIQESEGALSSLKAFRTDGRFRVIASGSMLGVLTNPNHETEGEGSPDSISPMGSARPVEMRSMDFEEFLWANNIPQDAIFKVRTLIKEKEPIPEAILNEFSRLYRLFMITGGMPASVQAYVDDRSTFSGSQEELEDIVLQIRHDITRYCPDKEVTKTLECFDSIPYQLADTNKRFHYSKIDPEGSDKKQSRKAADRYMENLLWLRDAGYGNFCYALSQIQAPLKGQSKRDVFKVYVSDTGILTHMYGDAMIAAIFTSDQSYNQGAVTENMVAESLVKCGYSPMYYNKKNGKGRMEIDFVVETFGGIAAIEVKSGKDRDAPSINKVSEYFEVARRILFENGNIHVDENGIEHYPLFASAFFDSMDERPAFLR